jgi:uncharacterized membrane protein
MENERPSTEQILGISPDREAKKRDELRDEKWLRVIADVVFIVGILASLVMLITIVFVSGPSSVYSADGEVLDTTIRHFFNFSGLAATLCTLLLSFLIRTFLRVIANISVSLKEINKRQS